MSGVFKFLKDGKRRAMETVLSAVGKSETTIDPEYNASTEKFSEMILDLNELGSAVVQALNNQALSFGSLATMSELLEKVYLKNTRMSPNDWPGATCDLTNEDGCRELAAHLYYIHNVLRASAQQIVINQGSRPIADNVTSMEDEVETKCKERDTKVKDFDSYRRRLKDLNAKKESVESEGKTGTKAHQEVLVEITRFESKREAAEVQYNKLNADAKADILKAKKIHDELVESLLIAIVFSQSEFMRKSSLHLEKVLALFPQDKLLLCKTRFQELVTTFEAKYPVELGRVTQAPSKMPGSTGISHSIDLLNTASFESDGRPLSTKSLLDDSDGNSNVVSLPKDSNSFASAGDNNYTASASGGASPDDSVLYKVVALYANVPDDADELSFEKGEIIEVLWLLEEEWWKGRNSKGQVGVFPSNYVKKI